MKSQTRPHIPNVLALYVVYVVVLAFGGFVSRWIITLLQGGDLRQCLLSGATGSLGATITAGTGLPIARWIGGRIEPSAFFIAGIGMLGLGSQAFRHTSMRAGILIAAFNGVYCGIVVGIAVRAGLFARPSSKKPSVDLDEL